MFCSSNVTSFVAVAFGVLFVCKGLSPSYAESTNGSRYNQQIVAPQYFRPEAPSKEGNPIARLRNDGRPFSLHIQPSRYSFETARIYPLARFVELLGRCTSRWCYVRYGNAVGWLSTDRFLEDPSGSSAFLRRRIETSEPGDEPAPNVEMALPVRRGLVPPSRQAFIPNVPTAATKKIVQPETSRIEQKNYALQELGGKLFLPVQEDHAETSRILGTIPFFARNVEALGICINGWCRIKHGSLEGWIERRHLTDKPVITKPRLQLEAVMPVDALNVYSVPDKGAELIVKIEPPVSDIEPTETCDEKWCYIRHSGIVGWVETRYLTRQ